MNCPLCLPGRKNEHIVLENKYCLFLQQPQRVLVGSGLIIPKEHRATVFDLTAEEWEATFILLHEVKVLLTQTHSPQGYNIGWNCGQVGGQEIPHAHLHIIPRFIDEPLAGKGIRYWLKQEENLRKSLISRSEEKQS
jgi:diadenosine tetraphosphate (Ap4A) HIT family hydrolase